MSAMNRRSFLATGAAIPLATWLERDAEAQAGGPFVRHDARSAQGQAMLKLYAKAVAKMKQGDQGSPTSWTFQWYTHWVKGPQAPVAAVRQARDRAIADLYPNPGPHKDLARAMWDNCEAHGNGIVPPGSPDFPPEVENYFVPWHRMFVFFFERIVRLASGDPGFTLPYWNYSTTNMAIRGIIPPEFTRQNDPTFGSLFVQNRNPGINQGHPIAGNINPNDPNNLLSLSALSQAKYEPTSGTVQGFNQTLDFGLHGNIHVGVGTQTNMGFVPTAAGDPIFWLHHCNIDRLWASWNAAGRANPALSQTFVFADERGQRVVGNIADFLNLARLDYRYDRLEPVPGVPPHLAMEAVRAQVPKTRAARQAIVLGQGPTTATLTTLAANANAAPEALPAHVGRLGAAGRIYLVVRGLQADTQPGVLYNLYLDLPPQANEQQMQAHSVGVINFFHAHPAGGGGHDMPKAEAAAEGHADAAMSFDITDVARSLRANNLLGATPALTIAPVGTPAADARPVIGEASIVEV